MRLNVHFLTILVCALLLPISLTILHQIYNETRHSWFYSIHEERNYKHLYEEYDTRQSNAELYFKRLGESGTTFKPTMRSSNKIGKVNALIIDLLLLDICIVVPTTVRPVKQFLLQCLHSLLARTSEEELQSINLLVLDTSSEGHAEAKIASTFVTVLHHFVNGSNWHQKENLDYILALQSCKGNYILVVEDDSIATTNYLEKIRDAIFFANKKYGENWFYMKLFVSEYLSGWEKGG